MYDTVLHIDAALSNVSMKYKNPEVGYIADLIMPRVRVAKRSDKIIVYKSDHLIVQDDLRRDKAESSIFDTELGTADSYLCEKHAKKGYVSQDERDNADAPLNPDIDMTEDLTDIINLNREKRVADLLCSTSNLTKYVTLGAGGDHLGCWDAYADAESHPLLVLKDGKNSVWTYSLKVPNTLILPYPVALALAQHPDIINLTKGWNTQGLILGSLPPVLQELKVVIASAGYNASSKGQTASLSGVWSDYAIIAYIDPAPKLRSVTLGLTFDWKGRVVRTWHDNDANADAIEVEEQGLKEKIMTANCGYLITNCLT